MVGDLLKKPLSDFTERELDELQTTTLDERKHRAFQELMRVAELYVAIYGYNEGLNEMGEDLCKRVAQDARLHPGGWDGLLRHFIKISG